jgi:hypothetical protein
VSRLSTFAVRRSFARSFIVRYGLPTPAEPPRPRQRWYHGDNVSPYRASRRWTFLWPVARSTYHRWSGSAYAPLGPREEWDAVRERPKTMSADKRIMNRLWRRSFKQQLAGGIEAFSEFRPPIKLDGLNMGNW